MSKEIQRLAVSGTYSTGKSTVTQALSLATGIPRTHASTTCELLTQINPGKLVEELSGFELLYFSMRRIEERIHNEAVEPGSFFSDGSIIHEWVYGEARRRIGIRPGAKPGIGFWAKTIKALLNLPAHPFIKAYMKAYGELVKNRAKRIYDGYIHLPVEFDIVLSP